jgi:hypothetical protein
MIDGLDQSEQIGPFNWGRRARGHLLSAELEDRPAATASHDGYALLGITHERSVSLDENTFRVMDRVLGSGSHHIRLTLQFAPGFEVETAGAGRWRVSSEHGPSVLVEVSRLPLAAHVEEQTLVPGPGAVSPRYNELIAAPALLFEGDVTLPIEVVAIITIATVRRGADGRG